MNAQEEDNNSDDDITLPTDNNFASFLPLEVVVHLMGFLPYPDRVAASLVCRHWYEASLHPSFINREKVVIKRLPEVFSIFMNSSRPYYHLMLIDVEINYKVKNFWQKVAPNLKSLYFVGCDVNDKMFIDILLSCVNLETLVLHNCRELFMSGRLLQSTNDITSVSNTSTRLKELILNSNRYLSDALLNRLMIAMPRLDSISLEGCQISYHGGLFKKYYPENVTGINDDYASETVLTFWHFYNSLSKRDNVIKRINLSRTLVDSGALTLLSESNKVQLEEIHITYCEQLTNAGVRSLCQNQKLITVLNLSYCSRITDQSLISICGSLKNLKKLAVRNCRAVTDFGIVLLPSLEELEELDISQCEQVTNKGILGGLCSKVNRKFKKLFMEGLNTITSNVLISMAEHLPELTHLHLSYCFNAVTDDSVQAIFEHQVKLRSLRLAGCDAVTDAGLTGMGVASQESADSSDTQRDLENIVISQPRLHISLRSKAEEEIIRDAHRKVAVQKMCEAHLGQTSNDGYSLVRLKGLQELDLQSCNKITDVSLKYSFRFLELQHLNISQCQQVTHVGLKSIAERNPSIETLNLNNCYNITDEGIVAVARGLHRLKWLDIKGCNQLTDASVVALTEHCRQLRFLDLSQCSKITDKALDMLQKLPLQTLFSRRDISNGPVPPAPPLPRF